MKSLYPTPLLTTILLIVFLPSSAFAWNGHQELVERMHGLSLEASERTALAAASDEPDGGMDQNLDASEDPLNERRWMGGTTGPTSQGFRHMYFGGWRASRPLTTFQIPLQAIGQAPNRVQDTATQARELFRQGDRNEGLRRLGWAGHYLQDLTQPFHAVQIVHWRMVPWKSLLAWPPKKGFEALVKETTRTISNYHWAYEGYVQHHVNHGAYDACVSNPEKATLKEPTVPPNTADFPKHLALAAVEASVGLAAKLGRAEMEKYGSRLKAPEIDLAHDKGAVEYTPRSQRLDEVTCQALANAAKATGLLVEWALHP